MRDPEPRHIGSQRSRQVRTHLYPAETDSEAELVASGILCSLSGVKVTPRGSRTICNLRP